MITIDHETESKLRQILGQDMDRIARDALVAEAYRTGKLSIGQAARLLGLFIHEAHGFMKERRIPVSYGLDEFDADCAGRRELRNGGP